MAGKRLKFTKWPEKYQRMRDWRTVPQHQRFAFSCLLKWTLAVGGRDPLDPATVRTYVTELEHTRRPQYVATTLSGLSLCLMDLVPELRWDWLRQRRHAAYRVEYATRPKPERSERTRPPRMVAVVDEWPAAVRDTWCRAIGKGIASEYDEFPDGAGRLSGLSSNTLEKYESAFGRFVAFARLSGLSDDVTQESVELFIQALTADGLRSSSITSYLFGMLSVLKAVEPAEDWGWLQDEANRFGALARYARKRKDGRVPHGRELYALGTHLCELARKQRPELAQTAVLFRDGLIFLMLAMAPARARTFNGIRIGRHLWLEGSGGRLYWDATETKEGRPEIYPIWPFVRAHIDEYLDIYRPILAETSKDAHLWLAENGTGALSYAGLLRAVRVRSMEHLGIAFTPHLARDTVALTVSEEAPGCMEIATIMLHHASSKSTQPYRDQADTIAASRVAREKHREARHRAEKAVRSKSRQVQADEIDEVFLAFT